MPSTTPRLSLPYALETDTVDPPRDFKALADQVDTVIGPENFGLLAARPSAGNEGFKYFATDAQNTLGGSGVWYMDNGSSWIAINPFVPVGGAPSSSVPGNSPSNGVSTVPAASDHVHGRENWAGTGTPYGTSASPARSDHTHLCDAGRAYAENPGSLTAGSIVTIATNFQDFVEGSMTVSSGALVVATPAYYLVTVQGNGTGGAVGDYLEAHIMKNGTSVRTGTRDHNVSGSTELCVQAFDFFYCATGTTLNLGLACSNSSMSTAPGTGASCWVSAYQMLP